MNEMLWRAFQVREQCRENMVGSEKSKELKMAFVKDVERRGEREAHDKR